MTSGQQLSTGWGEAPHSLGAGFPDGKARFDSNNRRLMARPHLKTREHANVLLGPTWPHDVLGLRGALVYRFSVTSRRACVYRGMRRRRGTGVYQSPAVNDRKTYTPNPPGGQGTSCGPVDPRRALVCIPVALCKRWSFIFAGLVRSLSGAGR